MKPEETIDFHIKKTWQAIAKMYNEEASKYGATMAEGFVLLSIDAAEGTPSTSLGPKMGMEATSLSRILKNLEERGLIVRKPNPLDRRGVLVFLTEFGLEKRSQARAAVLMFNETVAAELGEEKLKEFFDTIKIIDRLIDSRKVFQNRPSSY